MVCTEMTDRSISNYFMRQALVNIVPGHKAAEIAQSSGYIWSQHVWKPF